MSPMTLGSLFDGISGFPLAASWCGIKTKWISEIDENCLQLSRKNFPNAKQYKDIRELRNPEPVDIIAGGFPCQDISIAQVTKGKAKGIEGERSGLWKEYYRILGEIRPRYVVFENSPMLIVRGFEQVLCDLSRIGYNAEWRCFYATQFGYTHGRKRIYGVAYPKCERSISDNGKSRILHKILPKQSSRQNDVPMPLERFNSNSDYSCVRMYDGFSKGLDRQRIKGLGNSIITDIAFEIFKSIQAYELSK